MNHPPIHPGWKRVVLYGGPNDGQELTIRGTRNLIVTGVTDDGAVDPRSIERGAVYVSSTRAAAVPGSGERFDFLGQRTTEEIRHLLRSGMLSTPDDCGFDGQDPDWWRKGPRE